MVEDEAGSSTENIGKSGGKIGFYAKTAATQPSAIADATDAASAITQLNLVIHALETLGLIAS